MFPRGLPKPYVVGVHEESGTLLPQVVAACDDTGLAPAIVDVKHSMVHLWDEDGLWVGWLPDNPDFMPPAGYGGSEGLCSENFSGSIYTVPDHVDVPGLDGGDVLFSEAGRITRRSSALQAGRMFIQC